MQWGKGHMLKKSTRTRMHSMLLEEIAYQSFSSDRAHLLPK